MALLIVAVLSVFWCVVGLPMVLGAYDYDFLCYYIGGTLAREARFADLYQPAVQRQVQDIAAPGLKEARPFVRPPWFALALAPLTALPLVKAYAIWVAGWLTALLAVWVWGTWRFGETALLLAVLFMPTDIGFAYGQDCAAMLAVCCGAWALLERRRLFAGGAVLGLGLMKFHLLLLVPLWLIVERRWRTLAGFAASGAVFASAAFATLGVSGLRQYARLLASGQTELFGHSPDSMINVYSVLINLGIDSRAASVVFAVVVVVVSILGMRGAPQWRAMAIALTSSLLITPHAFAYDAAMLLLPVWLVMENSKRRFPRWSALALANPLIFYFTAAHPPFRFVPALALLVFLAAMIADRSEPAAQRSEETAAMASISTATSRGNAAA